MIQVFFKTKFGSQSLPILSIWGEVVQVMVSPADFSTEELIAEIKERDDDEAVKKGYWLTHNALIAEGHKQGFLKGFEAGCKSSQKAFADMGERLLKQPEEPKYTCAHCGKGGQPGFFNYGKGADIGFCNKKCHDIFYEKFNFLHCKTTIKVNQNYVWREERKENAGPYCDDQCAENYQWVPAEFPRDYGKFCRVKNGDKWLTAGTLVGRRLEKDNKFIVSDGELFYSVCQVRRDSVEPDQKFPFAKKKVFTQQEQENFAKSYRGPAFQDGK